MLTFAVYKDGKYADSVDLSGTYVVGSDDIPLRAEISFKDGMILCDKRAAGPAGLAISWDVAGVGKILVETVRLQERKKPYILQVELVRGRLLRITQKLEEWGLLDFEGTEEIVEEVTEGRELLIQALQAEDPAESAALADEALSVSVQASEALCHFHADMFLSRRIHTGGFTRRLFGCSVSPDPPTEQARQGISKAFDFVTVPVSWREVEPSEQTFNWKPLDAWVELLAKHRIPMKGSTLLSFDERSVPDWLYVWEHDFDTIRDLAFEHIRRVINRYGLYIQVWDVVSGLHANSCFTFSFEQLMELTRMAAALTKQVAPRAMAIVDIVAPWGEYYARNQRTIPPLLYADMVVQSGVNLDAFGLQFYFGPGVDGMFVRDMFQISSMLDQFAKLNRPLHITAVQVPSACTQAGTGAGDGRRLATTGGSWHGPWSEQIQSEWLVEFLEIALSKSFVDSVSWHELADHPNQLMPHGGLLRSDLVPKAAYHELVRMRAELLGGGRPNNGPGN